MSDRGRGRGGGGPPRGRGSPSRGSPSRGSPSPGGFQGSGARGGFQSRGGGGGGRGGAPAAIFSAGEAAHVPQRLTGTELQSLVDAFKSVKLDKPERPLRPGWGTAGTNITLRANFFSVRLPKGPIYDYVVEISPTTDIGRIKSRLFEILERSPQIARHITYIAHDRSQRLVSAKQLPQPLDIQVPFYDDDTIGPGQNPKVYIISIKYDKELDIKELSRYMGADVRSRDYNALPVVSALNLVMQQHANRIGTRVGKNRFFIPSPSSQKLSLSFGIEAVQGFYTSVRPTYKELLVNVNVCMTAFLTPGNLGDMLLEYGRGARGLPTSLPRSLLKSMRVKTLHLGYKKKLNAIGSTSARTTFFDCEELGGRVSVETYFLKKYNKRLRYPDTLPVVDVGTAKRVNWIPAELCQIEMGTPYRGKLNDIETAQMIKFACNPPAVNGQAIMNHGLRDMGLTNPPQSPVSAFGMEIRQEMSVIPGRELAPPRLTYKVGNAKVQGGSWNILDVQFQRGAKVPGIWVLVVQDGANPFISDPKDQRLQQLLTGFTNKLRKSGVSLSPGPPRLLPPARLLPPNTDPDRSRSLNEIRKTLTAAMGPGPKQVKPGFVLVLLERRDNYIYPGIKRMGDVELGIQTVHMQLAKAIGEPHKQDQYFSNVALKVNTKLGGINHLLDPRAMTWLTKKKTMMVGIDVTHPGPGSREGTPSIAAVVSSVDDNFVQFPASLRIQETKKEMLDELKGMMVERLLHYEKTSKALPSRVIVYRDGVSEGQFDTVLEEELPQILESFNRLDTKDRGKPYRPQLAVIICGKRHHAKFFPTDSAFASKNGNTRPGTVVDKGVTGVFDFDFYLQAHSGLQGHVKSTHYTVIYDEIGLQADEVQQGTHDASYLYARATKAVSLIPAAYYADLACERGRCYLNDFLVDDKTSVGGGSSRGRSSKEEEAKYVFDQAKQAWGVGLHPEMRETMFYI